MLIYGNTPKELRQMFLRKYGKALWILALALLLSMLLGCSKTTKPELKALDRFWVRLGGKMDSNEEVE